MSQQLIQEIEKEYMKAELTPFNPGDTVKVMVRIKEGNKERLQGYEGVVIKFSGRGISRTVTIRRVFQGVGVERIFLLHSPKLDSIKVLRRGKVRRAKLYYLRARSGKAARIKEKVSVRPTKAAKA
jgi:large subunit ribosomal protein L19